MNALESHHDSLAAAPGQVKEQPILFSGAMIQAILDGRKTQTRRVMNPQPPSQEAILGMSGSGYSLYRRDDKWIVAGPVWAVRGWMREAYPDDSFNDDLSPSWACPYGKLGDRLWVREGLFRPDGNAWLYRTDNRAVMVSQEHETAMLVWAHHKQQDHCPSMFMPRWASRITLEITEVRVQRLQDISEEDALAEGVQKSAGVILNHWYQTGEIKTGYSALGCGTFPTAKEGFRLLWDVINSKRGYPWSANPWVWCLSFRRV